MVTAPLPLATSDIPPAQGLPDVAVREYVRQWAALNWWIALSILGFLTGPIALALLIYAIIKKNALRQSAAEKNVDPEDIAEAGNRQFTQTFLPFLGFLVLFAVATLVVLFSVKPQPMPGVSGELPQNYATPDPRYNSPAYRDNMGIPYNQRTR